MENVFSTCKNAGQKLCEIEKMCLYYKGVHDQGNKVIL